ncbi:hypothetical protein Ahy_B03g066057 isoform A [Arachis hypogaea]|uniref:Protein FAR1-RELATED SEQUENCE n=1 Tax=Arachis hypogaea TaxID=3818 RepID=A0A445A339_ARAHY|nr:hypothetical protein Ahy_B03g066057 isoform A [Arachis hypogaea]
MMPKNLGNVFDRDWNNFLIKYGVGGNKWLSGLFEDHHLWILIYLDHHFWARMKSTQRSRACIHAFFNKFITCNSSLIQFIKEQIDREFDAVNFHTVIPYETKSLIEAQFQYVYTHKNFREVQAQFRRKVSNSTFNKFVITYDAISREVKCQCLLFESRGMLCHHSLSALSFERVDKVAPKCILERWSKNIKRRHTYIKSIQDEPLLELISKRFDDLVFRSHNICEFVSESKELIGILHWTFDKVIAEMQEFQAKSKVPPRVRTRGCSKNRLGSNLKKRIANASKKEKKVVLIELNFLDGGSTIQSSSSLYHAQDINDPGEHDRSFSPYNVFLLDENEAIS